MRAAFAAIFAVALVLTAGVSASRAQVVATVEGDMEVDGALTVTGPISAAAVTASSWAIGSTTSAEFLINADNATPNTEDAALRFSRGSETPPAEIKWDAAAGRFDFNFPLRSATVAATTLALGTETYDSLQGDGLTVEAGVLAVDDAELGEAFFRQGGNAFAEPAQVGTTDAFGLTLVTDGEARIALAADGAVAIGTETDPSTVTIAGEAAVSGGVTAGSLAATSLALDTETYTSLQGDGLTADAGVLAVDDAELAGVFYRQGGNAFAVPAQFGTTDAFGLSLVTNGEARIAIAADGAVAVGTETEPSSVTITGDASVSGALTVTSLAAIDTSLTRTSSADFLINADNASPNTEDASLRFSRGSETPPAEIKWDAAAGRFQLNHPLQAPGLDITSIEVTSLDLGGETYTSLQGDGLTADAGVLSVDDAELAEDFYRQGGNVFVEPATLGTSNASALGLVTDGTPRITVTALGDVGVGTESPEARLAVEGSTFFRGESLFAGTFGADVVDNGDFDGNLDGWAGSNWIYSTQGAEHVPGSTDDLVQAATVAEIGRTYRVSYTISEATDGIVEAYFGGVWGGERTDPGQYVFYPTATSEEPLMFRPITSEFAGAITDVSVELLDYDGALVVEKPAEFRTRILVGDRIDFPNGMPISIGHEAMPSSTTGLYNQDSQNLAIGWYAGHRNTTGHVTAVGWRAGFANTTGVLTAFGKNAGASNTDGHATFFGNYAGAKNTTSQSVCMGDEACGDNTVGEITAVGYYAGHANVDGYVTAIGYQSAYNNITGSLTAVGYRAAYSSTGTTRTTALGDQAAYANTSPEVTAVGYMALNGGTSGQIGATAVGTFAGYVNQTGRVSLLGYRAGTANTSGNTAALGWQAAVSNTTGHLTALGYQAGFSSVTANSTIVGHNAGFSSTGAVTLVGHNAGFSNTTGRLTALGHQAGYSNTTGFPTLFGYNAGFSTTTGDLIAIGYQAGYGATPANAPITDTKGILIGNLANRSVPSGTVLTNYVGIGDGVLVDASNSVVIGNSAMTKTVLYGNVGLGVSAPTTRLQVAADMAAVPTSSVFGQLEVTGGGVNSGRRLALGYSNAETAGVVQALTTSVGFDDLLLNPSGGNVAVGTTAAAETFTVDGTVAFVDLTGSTGAGSLCLAADGEVVVNAGSDACLPSTRDTKLGILPLAMEALDLLARLEPVGFAYRSTPERARLGFIAEDVAAVDARFATYDRDGRVTGVDAPALLAFLVAGLQDAVDRQSEMEDRLTVMERRLDALEQENARLRTELEARP